MVERGEPHAVVETKVSGDERPDLTLRALEQRIRQQEIMSELGVLGLQGATLKTMLAETVRLAAEGLRVQFCKISRYIPDEGLLLVEAGVGWQPGIVGVAKIGADLASPAGFALRTGKPVISNHLENEERFRTPEMLADHGIKRAMNVILQGDGKPYGVLEVDSRSENEFSEHDLTFLQGVANILGMAIERERNERHLRAALERQQFLVKEMNHRIKNSLTIVASLLQMQARDERDNETSAKFEEACRRVTAIARAHERLYRNTYIESMDLGTYVEEVCQDMEASVDPCKIYVKAERGINVKVDNAISVALIVVELITNCRKYGYPNGMKGNIWVGIEHRGEREMLISVRDEGIGLPTEFDLKKSRGLGMRIVNAFAQQLNTKLTFSRQSPGTEFTLIFPIDPNSQ